MNPNPFPATAAAPAPAAGERTLGAQWGWLIGILAVVTMLAVPLAFMLMIGLAMATDPCHGPDSPFRVCRLSAAGQNFLALLPWTVLGAATAIALIAAALFARRGHSPLYGIAFWAVGGIAAAVIGNEIAYLL